MLKISSKIEYVSRDLNPLLANMEIDITEIKFKNTYFDFIICNRVLERIKDDRKVYPIYF